MHAARSKKLENCEKISLMQTKLENNVGNFRDEMLEILINFHFSSWYIFVASYAYKYMHVMLTVLAQ